MSSLWIGSLVRAFEKGTFCKAYDVCRLTFPSSNAVPAREPFRVAGFERGRPYRIFSTLHNTYYRDPHNPLHVTKGPQQAKPETRNSKPETPIYAACRVDAGG